MKIFAKSKIQIMVAIMLTLLCTLTVMIAIPASASAATTDDTQQAYGISPLSLEFTTPMDIVATYLGSDRYKIDVKVDVNPKKGNVTYVDEVVLYWKGYTVEDGSVEYYNKWYSGANGTGTKCKKETHETSASRVSTSSYICFPLDLKSYFFNGLKRYDCASSILTASFILKANGDVKSQGVRGSYLHKTAPGNFSQLTISVSSNGESVSFGGASIGIFSVVDQAQVKI